MKVLLLLAACLSLSSAALKSLPENEEILRQVNSLFDESYLSDGSSEEDNSESEPTKEVTETPKPIELILEDDDSWVMERDGDVDYFTDVDDRLKLIVNITASTKVKVQNNGGLGQVVESMVLFVTSKMRIVAAVSANQTNCTVRTSNARSRNIDVKMGDLKVRKDNQLSSQTLEQLKNRFNEELKSPHKLRKRVVEEMSPIALKRIADFTGDCPVAFFNFLKTKKLIKPSTVCDA